MLKIDIINCNIEDVTKAYLFVLFALYMANKNTTIGNISIFKDFIISQLGINKDDP